MMPPWARKKHLRRRHLIVFCLTAAVLAFTLIGRVDQGADDEDDWSVEVGRRLRRLEHVCREKEDADRGLPRGYVTDEESGLSYCHVPKAASTFWLRTLLGLKHPDMGQDELRRVQGDTDGLHRLMLHNTSMQAPAGVPESSLFRFVFVRHPLRRLVSAYLGKILGRQREPSTAESDVISGERREFLAPLVRFVRERDSGGHGDGDGRVRIRFADFADFVADEVEHGRTSFGSLHWLPQHWLCAMCQVRLSFVGKLETMREDLDYLASAFPRTLAPLLSSATNPDSPNKVNSAVAREGEYRRYLGQLSAQQWERLCRVFKGDLDMFGYTCDID